MRRSTAGTGEETGVALLAAVQATDEGDGATGGADSHDNAGGGGGGLSMASATLDKAECHDILSDILVEE